MQTETTTNRRQVNQRGVSQLNSKPFLFSRFFLTRLKRMNQQMRILCEFCTGWDGIGVVAGAIASFELRNSQIIDRVLICCFPIAMEQNRNAEIPMTCSAARCDGGGVIVVSSLSFFSLFFVLIILICVSPIIIHSLSFDGRGFCIEMQFSLSVLVINSEILFASLFFQNHKFIFTAFRIAEKPRDFFHHFRVLNICNVGAECCCVVSFRFRFFVLIKTRSLCSDHVTRTRNAHTEIASRSKGHTRKCSDKPFDTGFLLSKNTFSNR